MVINGIDRLLAREYSLPKGARVGLLCNQASNSKEYYHIKDLLAAEPNINLTCLFSPQHGFFAEKQDNMVESSNVVDLETGLPVYSLYSNNRRPDSEMFDQLDVLVVDIVDVGTRVYTFLYTIIYCLELAAKLGKKVIILDRPNPIGGEIVEGNILKSDCTSFVGLYPLPMRHGLTIGEVSSYINHEFKIDSDLEIIPMSGWKRDMIFRDTGQSWVFPSPNMPTPETAALYPGQVLWEGTNISEGRGTTLPFELVGAPFLNHKDILDKVKSSLAGCFFRPVMFEPTSGKWAEQSCYGFHIHITDHLKFKPYFISLVLLQAIMQLYPREFKYKQPPYEYEFERLPMDLIIGDKHVRRDIEDGRAIDDIEADWQDDLKEFNEIRREYFLYRL